MTDEYDVFVEAEVEDRLLRKSRVEGRDRLREAIQAEIGFRAAARSETKPRDLRWFRGLFGMRIG